MARTGNKNEAGSRHNTPTLTLAPRRRRHPIVQAERQTFQSERGIGWHAALRGGGGGVDFAPAEVTALLTLIRLAADASE